MSLRLWIAPGLPLIAAGLLLSHARSSPPAVSQVQVRLLRVPNGGIQPQVMVDAQHRVHVLYLSGDPGHANIEYLTSRDDGATFSPALRVNSEAGSAIAVGNMRGPHLALAASGQVHVGWAAANGQGMLYTRLNANRGQFEPQRNVTQFARTLDGGAIAADRSGHVYVVWHGNTRSKADEPEREVWLAESADGGATFTRERPAWPRAGVCGCCGMAAMADRQGDVFILYRGASAQVHRDMYLLESRDHGSTFTGGDISAWNVNYCVMSTSAFAPAAKGPLAAWESEGQVYFAHVDPHTGATSTAVAPAGNPGTRKHPAIATNERGEVLLAWTEGMGWKRGGSLAWLVYGKDGRPMGVAGRADGVPVWSLVAAFARHDGSFAILY